MVKGIRLPSGGKASAERGRLYGAAAREMVRRVEPGDNGVIVKEDSANRKLGLVSATYVSQGSCPRSCPFFGSGCYAEHGRVGFISRRLNRSSTRGPVELARVEARGIDALSGDRLLRLHVVGDCRTNAAAQVVGAAAGRYARRGMLPRRGRKVWTYTHAWRTVERASWGPDVSVLASCETGREARQAMAAGYAAAVVVARFERDSAYQVDGTTVIPCPEQTRGITCRECGLCRDDERLRSAGLVIGFEVHSQGKTRAARRLTPLQMA